MSSFDGVNAVTIIFAALCVFAIGYRFYGLFIAAKVLNVDANRVTPAVKYADGQDYVKTDKFVLFGHHLPPLPLLVRCSVLCLLLSSVICPVCCGF